MKIRPFYLASLIIAGLLVLTLLWLVHGNDPARRHSWAVVGPLPAAQRNRLPTPAPVAPDTSAFDLRNRTAQALITLLKQRLERADARAHEGLLVFKDAAAYQKFLTRAAHSGLTVLGKIDGMLAARVHYDDLTDLQRELLQNGDDYAEVLANSLMQVPTVPAKENRSLTNQVPFGNSTLAFLGISGDHSQWGNGVTIAVLDSGVSPDITFGSGRLKSLDIGMGINAGSGTEDGHGTAVAALAAGMSSDAPGVAPAASLLSIRVTDAGGVSDIFTLTQGILAAVDAGAQIINISLGGYATNYALIHAIDYAADHGVVIVAAAGNDQAAQLTWPAADSRVISVGAIDALEQQVMFSNSGPQLQMTAPGYGVQTAWLNGQRVIIDGTSASAPIVAGAVAAMMSENPGLTATQAWQILQRYSSDAGAPGADSAYGNGILNVGWAMSRTDPTRVDTSISSHYFDAANNEMDFVIQNRGTSTVVGATLTIDLNGTSTRTTVATLAPGATVVVKTPVDPAKLQAVGSYSYRTQLDNPSGYVDQIPANNRKSSVLTPPKS